MCDIAAMPIATTPAGIDLYYETIGSPADPPLLLLMGYGSQMVAWPRGFSELLAAGGRFVIEFDNRDSGLSSKLGGAAVDTEAVMAAAGVRYAVDERSDAAWCALSHRR